MSAVLVLDVGMQPLRVESWQKAITDLFLGKTIVIEHSQDKTIRGVDREWPMPSVVKLVRGFSRSKYKIKFSRIGVYARDGFQCQYCGQRGPTELLSYDHVLPRAQGGKTTWENIVTACVDCNRAKANRTPAQAGMKLLSVPKRPYWLPQICVPLDRHAPKEWQNYWRRPLDT
jgi:5-methylcytosine-specific restriction endonuclease McrA